MSSVQKHGATELYQRMGAAFLQLQQIKTNKWITAPMNDCVLDMCSCQHAYLCICVINENNKWMHNRSQKMSVCTRAHMYACEHEYMCTCMWTCVYIRTHMCVFICMHAHVWMWIWVSWLQKSVHTCRRRCVWTDECLCVWECMQACMSVQVCGTIFAILWVRPRIWVCLSVYIGK